MILIVDTHALVWYLEDSPKLGRAARDAFLNPDSRFAVPIIVLAEAQALEETGRTRLPLDKVVSALEADPRFSILPLTLDVLRGKPRVPGLEMHDAIICATALVLRDSLGEEVQVITRDRQIIASGLVETVW